MSPSAATPIPSPVARNLSPWTLASLATVTSLALLNTPVLSVTPVRDGEFRVSTPEQVYLSRSVVIATGYEQQPRIPEISAALPADLVQLHSSQYRNPENLPEGAVLVVGSGQSGAQIAEDLFLAGRDVHLALGSAPRVERFYRGRDCVAWLQDMGVYDVPVHAQVGGLTKRESTNHYVTGRGGGRDIDLRTFARDGMHLYGRLAEVEGSRLRFAPTAEASLDYADSKNIETFLGKSSSLVKADDIQLATHIDSLWTYTEDLLLL